MPRCFDLGAFHPQLAPLRLVVVVEEDAGPLPFRTRSHTRPCSTVNTPQSSAQPNHCLFSEALARQTHTTESQAEPLPTTATQSAKKDHLPVCPPRASTSQRGTRTRGLTGALVNQDRDRHFAGHSPGAHISGHLWPFIMGSHASRSTTVHKAPHNDFDGRDTLIS